MAKELYEIKLMNPCQQKWQGMQASAAGRFCSACDKEVIDFTTFSNAELIDYFVTNKIKEGCGRFLQSQLATIKIPVDIQVFQKKIPQWKKFLIVLLVCFGKDLFNAEMVFSQSMANDSIRNSIVCDSSLPSETFDINDTLKLTEIKPPVECAEPDSVKLQEKFSIKDSFVFDTIQFDFKDMNIVLGGFGMLLKNDCKIPFFERNETADSALTKINAEIVTEPAISKKLTVKEDTSIPNNIPGKKESGNTIPFEAILDEDKPKKRRRK